MKHEFKKLISLTLFLLLFLLLAGQISAQEDAVDKEIKAEKERINQLNKQIELKKLREQREKLEKQLGAGTSGGKTGGVQNPTESKDDAAPSLSSDVTDKIKTNPPLGNPDKTTDSKVFGLAVQEEEKCSSIRSREKLKQDTSNISFYQTMLCDVVDNALANEGNDDETIGITLADSGDSFAAMIVRALDKDDVVTKDFLLKYEKTRTDKQIGSDSKNKGTTSIVTKGGIPALFGFAVENGAATSSIDGTTMTFRVNPMGLFQAVSGKDYLNLMIDRRKSQTTDFLSKIELGFSFDTSRDAPADTPTFTGSSSQLSAFSFRYEFINQRSPKNSRFQRYWREFIARDATPIFQKKVEALRKFITDTPGVKKFTIPALQTWLDNVNERLKAASADLDKLKGNESAQQDLVEAIVREELKNLPVDEIRKNQEVVDALFASVNLDREYLNSRAKAFDEIAKGQVATFEYVNLREPVKPDTHSLKFIWEKGILDGGIDFTLNAGVTFYNKKPTNPDVKRIRDFDFSGQVDVPMRNLELGVLKDSVLSFAAKYQRLNTDVVNENGTIAPGTKGDIFLGQGKFTIPIGDTGLKIPISFTFANRTDLIKEREVRANFGITIDFDAILAKLKSFNPMLFR
jgi:hypothetical protein